MELNIPFFKYQGAGNDFIIVDQRKIEWIKSSDLDLIRQMCDRRFGIGGDGLICIEKSEDVDFKMVYYNSDGRPSSMCGNGGRCIVALSSRLQIFEGNSCEFIAVDGNHKAKIFSDGLVSLEMIDVHNIEKINEDYIIDTGSPHFVRFSKNIDSLNMLELGRAIRYNSRFAKHGINVNYVRQTGKKLDVRTYERGVENETLACGTGVTAVALAAAEEDNLRGQITYDINARGGQLSVSFERTNEGARNIWLTGPADFVFKGEYKMKR